MKLSAAPCIELLNICQNSATTYYQPTTLVLHHNTGLHVFKHSNLSDVHISLSLVSLTPVSLFKRLP